MKINPSTIFGILAGLWFVLKPYGLLSQSISSDISVTNDTVLVDSLNVLSKTYFSSDPQKSILYSNEAIRISKTKLYAKGEAIALKNIGIVHYFQSRFLDALDYYNQSLEVYKKAKDPSGMANLNSNIGVIYMERGDAAKALEYYLESLKHAELANDKYRVLISLNNIGGIYNDKTATREKALDYFLKAHQLSLDLEKKEEAAAICVNIGGIYFEKNNDSLSLLYYNNALQAYGEMEFSLHAYNGLGKLFRRQANYTLALKNHNLALTLAKKLNNKLFILQSQVGVAEVYVNQNEIDKALSYYLKAQASAQEIEAKPELKDLYEKIAKAYALKKDYTKAYQYQSLYSAIKDTLFNEDIENKLGTLQFDFDLQKKQTEINLLTKDKAITDQKLERQRLAKTASLVGLAMVFLIATLLYRNYWIKSKTNQILDRQKGEIEQLLLNILPAEVANELKLKGHAVPKYYESVAVMFTDFEGFTFIAEKLTPQDLIQELNTCFIAFDHISEKYNLEKIKTIGDSYMVAGFDSKGRESREGPQNGFITKTPGQAPVINHTHIENIINASLEIRDFMKDHNARMKKEGRASWELRIGIHIGPVIAGVVGLKKYAYDIWGLAVNIASRMESNGEPGQVNVSSSVYELIRDNYICTYRGKIKAKNIGEIDMYFVEGLKLA